MVTNQGCPQTPGGRIRARPASEGAADVSTSKAVGIKKKACPVSWRMQSGPFFGFVRGSMFQAIGLVARG